jgi:hypothetical protein
MNAGTHWIVSSVMMPSAPSPTLIALEQGGFALDVTVDDASVGQYDSGAANRGCQSLESSSGSVRAGGQCPTDRLAIDVAEIRHGQSARSKRSIQRVKRSARSHCHQSGDMVR